MISNKQIEAEIDNLSKLGSVVETYKEIAATRVNRTKNSVVKSHNFLTEINEVFQQVKTSYRSEVNHLMKQKKIKDISKLQFVERNGKTVHVFISANTGLYGNIIERTFEEFRNAAEEGKKHGNHFAIIGRLGLFFARDAGLGDPYRYFEFPDNTVDDNRLREIAVFLVEYQKIVVYYPVFKTVVKQDPAISDISGNSLPQEPSKTDNIKYLFEPSLEKVLEFFEKEIFSIILEQTIRDSQLAKFASRLVSLDSASENIKKRFMQMVFDGTRLKHRQKNKKQSQTFSSMSLWGK